MSLEVRLNHRKLDPMPLITVKIVGARDGEEDNYGTGFFMQVQCEDNIQVPVIVTNRHVVEDYSDIKLFLARADENGNILYGQIIEMNVHNIQNITFYHEKREVDLAVISITQMMMQMEEQKVYQRIAWITSDLILDPEEADIEYVEEIFVFGYPEGLWDPYYNLPLVRRGITATPAYHQFMDEPVFLIDCSIFRGSSGSPIMIRRKGFTRLAGVNSGVYQSNVEGLKGLDLPIKITFPNNIGVAFMAAELHSVFERVAKSFTFKYARRWLKKTEKVRG